MRCKINAGKESLYGGLCVSVTMEEFKAINSTHTHMYTLPLSFSLSRRVCVVHCSVCYNNFFGLRLISVKAKSSKLTLNACHKYAHYMPQQMHSACHAHTHTLSHTHTDALIISRLDTPGRDPCPESKAKKK